MTSCEFENAEQQFPADAWELLSPRLTSKRREKLESVANERTKHIRLVVQDIHHPHNVSACLRSAEAFGVLDVDVVNLRENFRPSKVARGVTNWLNIHKHRDIKQCADNLHSKGYKILVGLPTQDSTPMPEISVEKPVAILFGNEHEGIHPEWEPHIDEKFTIPMVGFVESLNISVSAAITLNYLTLKAKEAVEAEAYFLSKPDRERLLCKWVCSHTATWKMELDRLREDHA